MVISQSRGQQGPISFCQGFLDGANTDPGNQVLAFSGAKLREKLKMLVTNKM